MTNFNFNDIAKELNNTQEEGITFEDKMLTWDTAEDVKEVVQALMTKKVVHFLKLDGNTLGVEAAAAIGKALEGHPEMRKAMWKNMFTRRLKSEIPLALEHLGNGLMLANAQLTVLDLSDNALGPNGMVGLEQLLRSRVCYSLQELLLNNCGLGIGGGRMLSAALVDCYHASVAAGTPLKLKTFIAGRNRLENDGAKAISKIFSTIKTLEMIAMPQNSIYTDGMAALAAGIQENPNLLVINLNDNTMRSDGAAIISEALAMTPKLREMNFGDCLLKTEGCYYLSACLEEYLQDIEVVDLGFNEIGPEGGVTIAGILAQKPKLKRLNLNGNQFGQETCKLIVDIMRTHPNALDDMDEDQSEDENEEDEDEADDEQNVEEEEDGESVEYEDEHSISVSASANASEATAETNGVENGDSQVEDYSADTGVENGDNETEEDVTQDEEEVEDEEGEGDDDEWEDEEGTETVDEEEEDYERGNDTTEEIDEYSNEDYEDNESLSTKKNFSSSNSVVSGAGTPFTNSSGITVQEETLINGSSFSDNHDYVPEEEYTPTEVFCTFRQPCSLEMFMQLPEDKLQAFHEFFQNYKDDELTIVMIFTALKCAHLGQDSAEALNCAKVLFRELFEYAVNINEENRILNHILIQLGLLRCEIPFHSPYNMKNLQNAVVEVLNNEPIQSSFIRNTLEVFLDNAGIICNVI